MITNSRAFEVSDCNFWVIVTVVLCYVMPNSTAASVSTLQSSGQIYITSHPIKTQVHYTKSPP